MTQNNYKALKNLDFFMEKKELPQKINQRKAGNTARQFRTSCKKKGVNANEIVLKGIDRANYQSLARKSSKQKTAKEVNMKVYSNKTTDKGYDMQLFDYS